MKPSHRQMMEDVRGVLSVAGDQGIAIPVSLATELLEATTPEGFLRLGAERVRSLIRQISIISLYVLETGRQINESSYEEYEAKIKEIYRR